MAVVVVPIVVVVAAVAVAAVNAATMNPGRIPQKSKNPKNLSLLSLKKVKVRFGRHFLQTRGAFCYLRKN